MAGQRASQITTTGQPSNGPQSVGVSEVAIDNAFNGRRREDEAKAAREAADRDKRLEQIGNNTIFSKQFENDIYNRQFQEISKSKLDQLYNAHLGGENIAVAGMRAVQDLREIGNRLHSADKNLSMTEAQFNKDPSSVSWFTQSGEVGGNKYQNVFQALKDPRTDGRIKELNDNFSNPAIMFQEDDINGNKIFTVNTNLGAAATMDGITEANKMITDKDYNRELEPKPFTLGNTQMERYAFGLQPETVKKVVLATGSNPAVLGYAIKNKFFADRAEALANGKNLTYEEWANTADIPSIPLQYLDNLTGELNERTGNDFTITDRKQIPRATAEDKALEKLAVNGTYNKAGDTWSYSMGALDAPFTTQLPAGTTVIESGDKKKTYLLKNEISAESVPIKVVFGKTLGDSYIEYQSKVKPDMKVGEGINTYRVPLDMQSINAFGQGYKLSGEAILNRMMQGSEQAPLERIDKFVKQIQGVSINKPAATTTKMSATGKVTPVSNEVERKDPKSGKIAIFDSATKKFIRWK